MSVISRIISNFGGSVKNVILASFLLFIAFGVVLAPVGDSVLVYSQGLASLPPQIETGGVLTISTFEQVVTLIFSIVDSLVNIFAGVAVLAIIWGGFQFMTNKPDEGKKWVQNGAIGLAIAISAKIIISIVVALLTFAIENV